METSNKDQRQNHETIANGMAFTVLSIVLAWFCHCFVNALACFPWFRQWFLRGCFMVLSMVLAWSPWGCLWFWRLFHSMFYGVGLFSLFGLLFGLLFSQCCLWFRLCVHCCLVLSLFCLWLWLCFHCFVLLFHSLSLVLCVSVLKCVCKARPNNEKKLNSRQSKENKTKQ